MTSEVTEEMDENQWGSLPKSLRERSQWVVTRNKAPIKPESNWTNPDHQLSFQQAHQLAGKNNGEPAYVLHADDPYMIIDIDDVGPDDPTIVSEEAGRIVQKLNTYTEASRSNTGLHLICRGTRLPDRCESGNLVERGAIEFFDANRYVVLTGDVIGAYDTIRDGHSVGEDGEDVLSDLQREYLSRQTAPVESAPEVSSFDLDSLSGDSADVAPKDVRQTLEEWAKAGGRQAQRIIHLWDSPAGSDCGYKSASEADMALVSHLAFWCREDAQLIDDCFRASSRMRPKWDTVHYADGRTYGAGTIQTAIRTNPDTFSGQYVIR
jgi:primase-polymerase (primpol)-like protein